jgi:hypothetical protein
MRHLSCNIELHAFWFFGEHMKLQKEPVHSMKMGSTLKKINTQH